MHNSFFGMPKYKQSFKVEVKNRHQRHTEPIYRSYRPLMKKCVYAGHFKLNLQTYNININTRMRTFLLKLKFSWLQIAWANGYFYTFENWWQFLIAKDDEYKICKWGEHLLNRNEKIVNSNILKKTSKNFNSFGFQTFSQIVILLNKASHNHLDHKKNEFKNVCYKRNKFIKKCWFYYKDIKREKKQLNDR